MKVTTAKIYCDVCGIEMQRDESESMIARREYWKSTTGKEVCVSLAILSPVSGTDVCNDCTCKILMDIIARIVET